MTKERQLRTATPSMGTMPTGKRRRSPPPHEVAEVKAGLDYLEEQGLTRTEIGRKVGLSRQAVDKWREGTHPVSSSLEALRTLVAEVRASRAKVRELETKSSGVLSQALPSRDSRSASAAALSEGAGHMAKLIQLRELPQARYPELEVALWYHAREIAAGAVSLDTIAMAQLGRLEAAGCSKWDAPTWWKHLVETEKKQREQFGPVHPYPDSERPQPPPHKRG